MKKQRGDSRSLEFNSETADLNLFGAGVVEYESISQPRKGVCPLIPLCVYNSIRRI